MLYDNIIEYFFQDLNNNKGDLKINLIFLSITFFALNVISLIKTINKKLFKIMEARKLNVFLIKLQ